MLTAEQVLFLEAHRIGHLATADAHATPHVVPVCFALAGGLVYTPLDQKPKRVPVQQLRRVRDLVANPAVCLTVDDYDEDWTRLRFLQVRGRAALVMSGTEHQQAIDSLRKRYRQYRAMSLEELPVIRITPERIVEWAWQDQTRYAATPNRPLP